MTLFDRPGPRWFTIPAHRSFVDDLARGLHEALGADAPEALADAIVLTPTRRAARALADAFLVTAGGRPVLLPQIRPLGDLDEGEPPFEPGDLTLGLPPAIGLHRRRFELAGLIAEHEAARGRGLDSGAALDLADALGAFLDSAQIEDEVELSRLDDLAPEGLAEHWRLSADFLRVAVTAWPARLRELGLVDVSARRVALLRALARRWREQPPPGVLIAAGSTGSAPATADLLAVVAAAPQGAAVLPGLDLDLADEAWGQVGEQHPQGALSRLLRRAGVGRGEVRVWPASPEAAAGRARRRLINEALRPPEATADWLRQVRNLREEAGEEIDAIAQGLAGLRRVSARDEEEAAGAIALLLRETLETPGRTAALVTPDAALARRVAARLTRWGVTPDSSAGAPLSTFPVAVLVSLTAGLMSGELDPVAVLAVLKHPLVRIRRDRELNTLERYGLRGPRPRSWQDVRDRLEREGEGRMRRALDQGDPPEAAADRLHRFEIAAELADDVEEDLATAAEAFRHGPATAETAARAHLELIEALAGDAEGRTGALWGGPEGEAVTGLFSALLHESAGLPPLTARGYADLIERLLSAETVRAGGAAHARIRILGAIEARLVRADRLVLAGLEEGVWPAAAPTDPFLSRPMRAALGLPPPERRVGLAAHDFAQAACAPEVFLVHSEKRGGQPAVKSRWLWRLETLARGAEMELPTAPDLLAHARALDRPERFRPAPRPRPKPPVAARPRELAVTAVETWIRDPYAVYARRILDLRPLNRPDEAVGPRERGSALHKAFERFAERHPLELPADAEAEFAQLMREALVEAGMGEPAMAREGALADRSAPWAAAMEARRRDGCRRLVVEHTGVLSLPDVNFTVTAKADRLEVVDCGSGLLGHVIDFKTGGVPSKKELVAGLAPQLTLTAAILAAGGFAEVGPVEPGQLVYLKITGRREAGREEVRAEPGESAALAAAALAGLKRRVRWFDEEATPYLSRAIPKLEADRSGDYDHLARVWEWAVIAGDEEEAGEP